VPETEGPVKATDQLNGREKMQERERIKYGRDVFRVGSGDAERVVSGTETDCGRDACWVGLGDAELVRCCGRGWKGVGNGTERGK